MASHHHDHGGTLSHEHGPREIVRLRRVLIFTLAILVVEIIGGFAANSLALLSDAGHMSVDALALFIALFAYTQATKARSPRHTFGFRRLEIVAALVNGSMLLWISGVIAKEAWDRLHEHAVLRSELMLVVALLGLIANLVGLFMLRGHRPDDLNMKGAFFHLLGDTLSSVGTIAAALIIRFTGWVQADAIASFLISLLILVGGTRLILESLHYLLEGTPPEIELPAVEACLRGCSEVLEVHDLHVWRISTGMDILTAHVVVQNPQDSRAVRARMRSKLKADFGLSHATIEVEGPDERGDPEHARGLCLP